jgi:hypothetical protein
MTDIIANAGAESVPTVDIFGGLGSALRKGEIALALGVVAILVVLIVPMPTWLLAPRSAPMCARSSSASGP